MSSHIDKDYLSRLKAIVIVTAGLESSPRADVKVLASPLRRLLTPWHEPATSILKGAVPFASFDTPEGPPRSAEDSTPIFPKVEVPAGYLAMNGKGKPVVLVQAFWMNKPMENVYRERSVESFLDEITLKARFRDELVGIEEAVWEHFGQYLIEGRHTFKCTYSQLQQSVQRAENRHRRRMAQSKKK